MAIQEFAGSAVNPTPAPPGVQGMNCTAMVSQAFTEIVAEPLDLAVVLIVVTTYCPSKDFTQTPFF